MKRVTPNLILTSLLASSLILSGCHSQKVSQGVLAQAPFLDGLYVTRPDIEEPLIAILKLQNPALLETAEKQNGQLIVDKELLASIMKEQEDTIAELQKISPQIRVLIRYKLVLNGLAIWAPANVYEKINSLPNVIMSEKAGSFARPRLAKADSSALVGDNTSVKFIGAEAAYAQNIHGEGLRVGVIDTGVDYTHKMFLGEGTEEAYKNIDPSKASSSFPNKKVVGGLDLVGTEYNSGAVDVNKRIPIPDENPLDEGGHGTHVAGTVSGIGDGINTYSGVAPAADLYAIKVFGADGSTSDEVVIAALEYAADPTGDLSFSKQLDVVNLSLGGGYGNPHIMYNHAIRNLVRGGTVVVAAAGNDGDKPYIVGAPSVTDHAVSVASSIDNQSHNTQFPTAEFTFANSSLNTEYVEGAITAPLADINALKGELIFLGYADTDFDSELKEQIKGKVALIDRGKVSFADKIKRASDSGAIAVIVANNVDGEAFVMGGDGLFPIPGIMITKKDGTLIKEQMQAGVVTVDLKSAHKIDKSWLADTISEFSSRGPRSEDGVIKPEIAAPGTNIISALMGGGAKGVLNSGTSMASPHIAGVMALLKQKYPSLSPQELKSVLLIHGKVISDENKKAYSISRQGAGRVQIAPSLEAQLVTIPSTLSLGITDLEKQKSIRQELVLKNISSNSMTLTPQWTGSEALKITAPTITLNPGETQKITITAKLNAAFMKNPNDELDGFLTFTHEQNTLAKIPALVVVRQISKISAKSLIVQSTSEEDAPGSSADLVLENAGVNKGTAYLFNLLGKDARKKDPKPDLAHNRNCDMQSAGYRVIEKDGILLLQVAVKQYEGQTTWNTCEVNVQIDANGDNKTDQEIAGLPAEYLAGLKGDQFVSLLLDGDTARALRKKYEQDHATDPKKAQEDYSSAVIDQRGMQVFDNSTLAIIEADISALALGETGELNIKVSTTHQDAGAIEYDDYLEGHNNRWEKVSLNAQAQAYQQLPEVVELKGNESVTIPLIKGFGSADLIIYAPQNKAVRDILLEDAQSQVIKPTYSPEN